MQVLQNKCTLLGEPCDSHVGVCLTLTAVVQPVQAVNVVPAHLGGLAQDHVAVGNRNHGGTVVLGEGVPEESRTPECM